MRCSHFRVYLLFSFRFGIIFTACQHSLLYRCPLLAMAKASVCLCVWMYEAVWKLRSSSMLYGSECWCLKKEDERRILTAEMTWLRRLLTVTRRDKTRNETLHGILCQETTLVDSIAERRLNWFRHVSRMGSERLPAKALHCCINGKRNQGRQPKKWMDNVNEDMKMKSTKKLTVQQAVVLVWDRNKWKHQVAAMKWWKRAEEEEKKRVDVTLLYCVKTTQVDNDDDDERMNFNVA